LLLCLVLAAPASRGGAVLPAADSLAPLEIPSVAPAQSDFAPELVTACAALTGKSPQATPATQTKELGPNTTAHELAAALQPVCDRIWKRAKLGEADRATLRAFWLHPTEYRAKLSDKSPAQVRSEAPPAAATLASAPAAPSKAAASEAAGNRVANFIYERAKEEAQVYLAKQLANLLCGAEVKAVFGHLCVVFGSSDLKISLSATGSYLAAAARSDLEALPEVVLADQQARLNQDNDPSGEARRILFGARLGLAYYRAVKSGRSPLEVARSLQLVKAQLDEVTESVRRAYVLPSKVLDAALQQAWYQQLGNRSANSFEVTCYALGVLLALDQGGEGKAFDEGAMGLVPLVANLLVELGSMATRLADDARQAQAASEPGAVRPAGLKGRAQLATQVLQRTLHEAGLIAAALGAPDASAARAGALERFAAVGEALLSGDLSGYVLALSDQVDALERGLRSMKIEPQGKLFDKVKALTPFISQLAQAKTADEVAALLQAAAVPANLYERKYKDSSVSLNSMLGAASGFEGAGQAELKWSGFISGFTPIGVHATFPLSDDFHLGVFVSVLNLGAIVSTRLHKDTTAGAGTSQILSAPNINIANVLSPGAFLTLGLFRSPFLIGVGAQVVPAGREVLNTDPTGAKTVSAATAIQVLGFLSIDIPIFPF
jgi:hypothetical protein